MLWNLDKFMNWCVKYSEKHTIQFNQKYIAAYCDFVEYLTTHDGGYKRATERMTGGNGNSEPNIAETLRMTATDPEWY